jgi:hypothetical protein
MSRLHQIIQQTYMTLGESNDEGEYYGFSLPLQEVKKSYQVACRDCDCMETVDIDELKSGDTVFVAEDDEDELYEVKIL